MRLAVVTLGSAGDLHPYLAIAREMHQRGHEVHLLSQEPHRAAVEAEGVRFVAIASEHDHLRTLQHPGLWHPVGGFGVLWRHLCVPAIVPTFEALAQLSKVSDERLTVLASPLAVGARLFRESSPIRLLTAYTAPSALRSCRDPMYLGAWRVPRWLPRAVRTGLWRALDAWKLEPMAQPKLKLLRARWGLSVQEGSTFGEWIHSPDGGIALFPAWFASPSPDWPVQPTYAGFPVFESTEVPKLEQAALHKFLTAGAPPVVVSPGSAASGAREFLCNAITACRSLSYRAVLLSAYPDQWPDALGKDMLVLSGARLDTLLPHSAAIIHHGGIGTCAQAFTAKTPQLVLPSAYDQFDNADRVVRSGWGISLTRHARSAVGMADALSGLLAQRCMLDRAALTADDWPSPSYVGHPNKALKRACEILTSQ